MTEEIVENADTPEEKSSSLVLVQKTLAEFDRVSAGLDELTAKYKNVVYAVATTKGMDEAKAARVAIREPRYAVANAAKAAKAPLNALRKNIDERAEQITEVLVTLEEPIDQQIKAEEVRKEEERRVKAEAEACRVAVLRSRIELIAAMPIDNVGATAEKIAQALRDLNAVEIDASFEEFTPHAADAKEVAVSKLITMHQQAVAKEAEQEAFRLAQEDLARQQAAAAAEARRLAEERAAIEADRAQAEAAQAAVRQADEDRATALRKQLDDAVAKAEVERKAEAQRLADFNKSQQDAFEAERLEAEKKLQADRDQLAAERRAHQEEIEATRRAAEPVVATAETHANGAPRFSTTTFKDNGKPIMLNADGERSVFCDLNDAIESGQPFAMTFAGVDVAAPTMGAEGIISALVEYFETDRDTAIGWIVAAAEELSGVAA